MFSSLVVLTSLLTGCASYQAASLNSMYNEDIARSSTKEEVMVTAKAFSKEDCARYLDRDVLAKGYQPVQIGIFNNTSERYYFSINNITLPSAPSQEVAKTVHTSTVGRSVGYGIAGLILWPFIIPAIVDGVGSAHANQSLDNDFAAKSAKSQVLEPYSRINSLIFVPVNQYTENFSITLIDEKTKEKKTIAVNS